MAHLFERLENVARVLLRDNLQILHNRRTPIRALEADELADAQAFFPMPKFFIYGHARSGTTLLARLVGVHPQVHCHWQAHFFSRPPLLMHLVNNREAEDWLSHRSFRWNRGRDLSPVVLRATADFILERDARRTGKTIVGDKSPNSSGLVGNRQSVEMLHRIYPDAALIFIIRDAREAVFSHRYQRYVDSPGSLKPGDMQLRAEFIATPQPFVDGKRSLFLPESLRREIQLWAQNVNETQAAGRELFGEHYHSLRYEDLLVRPLEEMKHIWALIGADVSDPALETILDAELKRNPDDEWREQKDPQLAIAIKKAKKATWRNMLTSADKAIFKEIAGDLLIQYGYEKDNNW